MTDRLKSDRINEVKRVVWGQAIVNNQGFNLQNYLTEHNFQPGKFFVLPFTSTEVQIFYVVSEEAL